MKKFYESEEFIEYLKSVECDTPFKCNNLKIVPEEVTHYAGQAITYQPNTLICLMKVGNEQVLCHNSRCTLSQSGLVQQEDGSLESRCSGSGSKIKITIEKK